MFQKYRDPLHVLLDYIAEVSTANMVSVFAAHDTPDLNVNYLASI